MSNIRCTRCQEEREPLPAPPWPGEQGERIQHEVCRGCWREWQEMQVKVINEFRLNLGDAAHAEQLDRHMMVFLRLMTPEEAGLPTAPYGYGDGGPQGSGEEPQSD